MLNSRKFKRLILLFIASITLFFFSGIHAENEVIQLTAEEKSFLAEHPVLRIGIDPSWAPIEFVGKKGEHLGISAQYLRRLEKLLGIKFEVVKGLSWAEAHKWLEYSQLDILPAVSVTPKRQKLFNFTDPYVAMPNAIFSATDKAFLGGLDALKGKRVVAIDGYATQHWLNDEHPEIELVTVPDLKTALRAIDNKEAFAFVGNLITTSYYIGQERRLQIRVAGETTFTNHLAIAVRKDWDLLPGILQKGLDAIPQSEKNAIYNSWISIKYQHSVDYTLLWQVLGLASTIILVLILYWNRRLSKEIMRRSKIETQLKRAKGRAEAASQAKTEFLSIVSHELRTPLNAIVGFEYLMQQTSLSEKQRIYASKMRSSAEILLNAINNILDFSKGEADKQTLESISFNLNDTLEKLYDVLGPVAEKKRVELTINKDSHVPECLIGDPQKLLHILLNLGSNAIKFTGQGSVKIAVKVLALDSSGVELCFVVKDTGIGISADQQKNIFKPFLQEDSSISRNYEGTGLGLAICQQLVQLMQGEITLKSEKGKGSIFSAFIKLKINPKENASLSLEKVPQETIENIKASCVLAVDDNELNLFLIEQLLLPYDINVVLASNGKEALEALEKQRFDIVLMDIQMPIMDGYSATKIIRAESKWQYLPIIAVSAHALKDERERCFAVGMNDYLSKPVDPILFYKMIAKWV